MPEPTGTMMPEQRVAEQAETIVADDVARTAATGRLKKRVAPRRLHPLLPSGAAGVGCLLVLLLIAGSALAVVLTGGPSTTGQATPTPTAAPTPTTSAPVTATPTPTLSPTATGEPTLADIAHALAPPDVVTVTLDTGDEISYVYEVISRRSLTELDFGFYARELPAQGFEIMSTRRFDSSVIHAFRQVDDGVFGQVSLELLADATTRVQIGVSMPPVDGGGPILSAPDPTGDTVTDSGNPVSDPEVDIVNVSIQKVGDRYRVTVEFASGLTLKYSYAVVLDIGHEAGPPHFILSDAVFIWQTHGLPVPELLIGQIDPKTSELVAGEAEGVHITFDQASGTVVFEFGADRLPAAADRYRILSYHRASPEAERNRDATEVITFGGIICGGTCQR